MGKKTTFRAKITIVESAFSRGHGHMYQFQCVANDHGGRFGAGCIECGTTLADVVADYAKFIKGMKYFILDSSGKPIVPL